MIEREQFGPCLRRERERRGISLQDIASQTKISVSLFAALERNDFSRWPGGIFRRSFVRAYAQAVGLDVDRTVRDFVRLFPTDEEARARRDAAQSASPAETPRALHLVAGNAAPSPLLPRPGRSRLAMAGVEMVLVGGIGTAIGIAVDWFYAWPAFGLGAAAVVAANAFRRKPARPAAVPPPPAKTKAAKSRHIPKRRGAAPPETGRTHHPRRPERTRRGRDESR